jgi:hypothetical protein
VVTGLLLRAYSLGGGTYTGIEAVSNNIQSLAEPRITTGRWTMFYMALSLAFMAGGIILLYLLWDAQHVEGRTLNAVTFEAIIASFGWNQPVADWAALTAVLAFEAGLLLVAATRASSADRRYSPTWPWIPGCRGSSSTCRAGW